LTRYCLLFESISLLIEYSQNYYSYHLNKTANIYVKNYRSKHTCITMTMTSDRKQQKTSALYFQL